MRLWGLLESECHKLDLQLAQHSQGKAGDREGFKVYTKLLHDMEQLKEQHRKHTELATVLDNSITSVALQLGDEEEENPLLS